VQLGAIHLADRISDCLPYLEGALVSYKTWNHSAPGGFSVKEAQTGIVTRVSYNAFGSGRVAYAVFDILHPGGWARIENSQPDLRIIQLANGATFSGVETQYSVELYNALRAAKRRAEKH
jgi:hypothetical protein